MASKEEEIDALSPTSGASPACFAGPTADTEERKLWFDALPVGLVQKISMCVSGGKQTNDMMNFAMTGKRCQNAVISALSNKLVISSSPEARSWNSMALEGDLAMFFSSTRGNEYDENALSILRRRSEANVVTRSLLMNDGTCFLNMIRGCNISEVTIILDDSPIQDVFGALSQVSGLKKLTLACKEISSNPCCFKELTQALKNEKTRAFLGKLEAFHLRCRCYFGKVPMWSILPLLSSVRDLVIYKKPENENLMEQIRKVHSLRIRGVNQAVPLLSEFGRSVVDLYLPGDIHSSKDMIAMRDCTNLRKLFLTIKPGTEEKLSEMGEIIKGLRVLHLSWYKQANGSHPYRDSVGGAIFSIAEKADELEDLCLENVRVNLEEMQLVLQRIGGRLKQFSCSIAFQKECPLYWIDVLMETIINHNVQLNYWSITEDVLEIIPHNKTGYQKISERLAKGLKILMRLLPRLQATKITKIISVMKAETETRHGNDQQESSIVQHD